MPTFYSTPNDSVVVEKVHGGYVMTIREQHKLIVIGVRDDGATAYSAAGSGSSLDPVHLQTVRTYLPYVDGGVETAKRLYQGVFDDRMAVMIRRQTRRRS